MSCMEFIILTSHIKEGTITFNQIGALVRYSVCLMHTDSTGLLTSSFGQGTGPIFLDNVACVGTENSLEDCTHDPSATDCTHHEDAAVQCNPHCKRMES